MTITSEEKKTTKELIAPDFSEVLEGYPLWSEVLEDLWVGGTASNDLLGDFIAWNGRTSFITKNEFDTVVTMYQYANPADWLVTEYRYCVYDAGIDLLDKAELFATAKFAHDEWKRGKRVLIRCQAGLNRSGLVMALVLIREGFSAENAIALLRKKRHPKSLCNRDFVRFLTELDEELWRGDSYQEQLDTVEQD